MMFYRAIIQKLAKRCKIAELWRWDYETHSSYSHLIELIMAIKTKTPS
jgi:hypothetical protein